MSTPTLQQYDGKTIEEALATAMETTGTDVEIVDAQRVRSGGVLGFFAKERYEVQVTPKVGRARVTAGSGEPASPQRFDAVLRAMVDRVDGEEAHAGRLLGDELDRAPENEHADGANEWWHEADFVVDGLDGELVIGPAGAKVFEVEAERAPGTEAAPSTGSAAAPVSVDLTEMPLGGEEGASPWSRRRLIEIGVPAGVVALLPESTPASELEWLTALTAAIESTRLRAKLATPADSDCVVNGKGASSALTILRAIEIGLEPGLLSVGGRIVPASALELSLAIRTCLLELPRR